MDKRRKILILGISLFVIFIILTVGVITDNIADKNDENAGLISIPFSSLDLEKENYAKVVKQLEDAGFVNVVTLKIEDLSLGIVTKDGEVESLTIDSGISYY
ncbi:hypothetical protein [Acetobacterium sp.]|uniref:hypothetical protein n=1 Tax=Acetobacterium sp. TaxID=1872094 RepID=UPI00359470A7